MNTVDQDTAAGQHHHRQEDVPLEELQAALGLTEEQLETCLAQLIALD